MTLNRSFSIIILFTIHFICIGQQQAYIQYAVRDGLPSNYVYKAFQDSKGFMWFGTDAGVSRFNGYEFENYSMQDGLADNDIFDILEDQKGRIWFATFSGKLCYYKDQKFHNSNNDPILKGHDFVTYISCLYEDNQGNVWFGSKNSGIIYLDVNDVIHKVPKSKFFNRQPREPATHAIWQNDDSEDVFALTNWTIENLTKKKTVTHNELGFQIGRKNTTQVKAVPLSENDLLVTENGNFHVLNYKSLKLLKKVTFDSINNAVVFLEKDKNGDIWAGNYNGIFRLKNNLRGNALPIQFLKNLTVTSRKVDSYGNTWYTTLQNGIYFVPTGIIKNYTVNTGLPEKAVNAVSTNKLGITLIGQGDYYTFINEGVITSMTENPYYKVRKIKKGYAQKINKVSLDDRGQYLVVSNYGLIAQQEGKTLYYASSVKCAINYKNKSILIGDTELLKTSMDEMNSVQSYNDRGDRTLYYNYFKTRLLTKTSVNELYWNEHTDELWITLNDGLMQLSDNGLCKVSSTNPVLNGRITSIIGESKNAVWIASGQGIMKLDKNAQPILHITTSDGLSSNMCTAIAKDEEGNLWVATNFGLNKVNFQGSEFIITQYGRRDGLLSDKINDISIHGNKIWVATDEGLSEMYLNNKNSYDTPLYITDIRINGNKTLSNIDWNKLTYDQNNVSVDFVALDYRMVGKIYYRYKLNESQNWNYTTNNNLEFSSLTHGNYSFIVQGKNKQGTWSDQTATFNFTIAPPLWRTWWAYLGYFLLSIGIIYAIFIYEFRRKLLKSELQLEKKESIKIKELEQLKSHFFSNISHEFRTPLTLILGPLEQIVDKINDGNIKRQLQIVNRNASGLLHLINQLLDVSKLESGKLALHLEYKDIMLDIDTIAEQFEILVKQKGIHFEVNKSIESLIMQYDPKKMEMILNNLLSNAMKFTPKGGSVKLDAYLNKEKANNEPKKITITISDTGIGISQKNIPHIFERFYQEDSSVSKEYEGTGIGLSLTKDMIELHQGNISVKSVKREGSTFSIILPVVTDNKNIELPTPQIKNLTVIDSFEQNVEIAEDDNVHRQSNTPTILIVEDNAEMRLYLKDILADIYQVKLVENGEIGVKMAKKIIPDLIVSDVMMPKLSGIELCTHLKQHELTSHIPIILLTAKAATKSKVEGFETGADGYITKPFSALELKAQIKSLINQREKLRVRFSNELNMDPKELAITSADKKFIQKALDIIENNMSNFNFSVLYFADEMNLSRGQLHKKLKALTNQSPTEFNRTIRLKRAKQLIQQQSGNISEIAYEVGFNDPLHFSKSFKKIFGKSPSEFQH